MKKINTLLVLLFITTLHSVAQESQYFTMYFQGRSKAKTDYERRYVTSGNQVSTEDYKKNKLTLSGAITGTTDATEADLFVSYIRSMGYVQRYRESFKTLEAKYRYYYEAGGPSLEVVFFQNKIRFTQAWSVDGKEQLTNGTGIRKSQPEPGDPDSYYEEYKDSVRITSYCVRHTKGDTLYQQVDTPASPKEGIQAFGQHVVKVVKYPTLARFVGKEGKVFIYFVVDENGKLTEFSPKTNEGFGFETKVVRKLEEFPNWNPAVYKGRPVKSAFVLPINYKLTN
ncbi:energy transducer TonB [Chryseolinea lacunae]|uniref:Energy transducer TonB n=1 Tax=Chryseolinea lacunae TaxID=2801331 RepID=A0ABS1KND7_9BACT|nr:energy transducer TonB [Chryseolinea lacunae]MBL0740757.1 energy transducer TonB [Chryseolinea lacunae]